MELFDTHAHYDDEAFDGDRDALLSTLPEHGVSLALCPGCDLASSQACVALAERYGHLYAAVGFHPENLEGATLDDLAAVETLAAHPRVKAIGEIGLDYYWEKDAERRRIQRDFFSAQLALAQRLNLPVIVHDREAHGDCLALVREFPGVTGVFHCFSGSPELALALVDLGWYVGFDGPVTYKNARRAPEVIAAVPLDRILLETDSPYMAPEPYRGKRNDSRYLHRMAEAVAAYRGLTCEEVARATMENGRRLFQISHENEALI